MFFFVLVVIPSTDLYRLVLISLIAVNVLDLLKLHVWNIQWLKCIYTCIYLLWPPPKIYISNVNASRGRKFHGGKNREMSYYVMVCNVIWCDVMWCHAMSCHVVWCDGMWLCDVLNCEMMRCELQRAHVTANPVRRLFQCAVQPWDARHKKTTESPCHRTTTRYYKELPRTTMYYSILQSTAPVYSVQQSTTAVLLRTTKYYLVLLHTTKHYSVLKSTTPVLQSITLYYKVTPVLLHSTKYYSVLHIQESISPKHNVPQRFVPYFEALERTTRYYKVLQITTKYYKVFLRTKKYYSIMQSTTKIIQSISPYYKYKKVFPRSTIYSKVYYKVLPRPNPFGSRNTWNVSYIARSNLWDAKLYWTSPWWLLLDWTCRWLNFYSTEILLGWTTWLNCYFTELLLSTWLNCNLTELLLAWTTELLLDGTVTLLN